VSHILVVDDDASIRALLQVALAELGTVITAEDGAHAIAATTERVPALAVLDVMMPGVSGLSVLEMWRADPRTREMPVIMLSARDQPIDRSDGYGAGADAYVTKPFEVDVLLTLLRTLMVEQQPDPAELLAELRAHPEHE
jgi:DNA-binding response OmpR family regulator